MKAGVGAYAGRVGGAEGCKGGSGGDEEGIVMMVGRSANVT